MATCLVRHLVTVSSGIPQSWYPQSFLKLQASSKHGAWPLANWEFVKPVLPKYFPIKHQVLRIIQTWSELGSSKLSRKLQV